MERKWWARQDSNHHLAVRDAHLLRQWHTVSNEHDAE